MLNFRTKLQEHIYLHGFESLLALRIKLNLKILQKYEQHLSLTSLGHEVFESGEIVRIIPNSYAASVRDYLNSVDRSYANHFNIRISCKFYIAK